MGHRTQPTDPGHNPQTWDRGLNPQTWERGLNKQTWDRGLNQTDLGERTQPTNLGQRTQPTDLTHRHGTQDSTHRPGTQPTNPGQRTQPTFGLGADGEKAVVGEQPEERADAVRVSAQDNLPVGGVHDAEGEDSIQLGRHGLGPQLVVQVNQRLAVTLRAHL